MRERCGPYLSLRRDISSRLIAKPFLPFTPFTCKMKYRIALSKSVYVRRHRKEISFVQYTLHFYFDLF